jgi:hypothetical protein
MENQLTENDQIIGVIKSLSVAWREKRFDSLGPWFAEGVIFQDSKGSRIAEGKEACVQSYRDFMGIAKVLAYEEEKPDLIPFGGFVMASYGWRIDYEMNGANFHDEGRDWLALEKQEGFWRISWRLSHTQTPE